MFEQCTATAPYPRPTATYVPIVLYVEDRQRQATGKTSQAAYGIVTKSKYAKVWELITAQVLHRVDRIVVEVEFHKW